MIAAFPELAAVLAGREVYSIKNQESGGELSATLMIDTAVVMDIAGVIIGGAVF